jgi:hypothetical protein
MQLRIVSIQTGSLLQAMKVGLNGIVSIWHVWNLPAGERVF